MSIINVVPASTTITVEQVQVSTIFFNINDTSCSVQVAAVDTDTISTSSSQSLLLSGTDFSSIINIASLKTWICTQLGYTEA